MSSKKVIKEAEEWIGTPYHHHGRLKGVGVDCAMLICKVFENAGATPEVDPGFYSTQFGYHRSEEQFISWVEKYGKEVPGPVPGGVVLMKYGRCFSHGGVVVEGGFFIHAVMKVGQVIKSHLSEPEYACRETKFYELDE